MNRVLTHQELKSYAYGLQDGAHSASLKNPMHKNWKHREHPNPAYVEGYLIGYAMAKIKAMGGMA